MKVEEKIYIIHDEKGNEIDLKKEKDIRFPINDQDVEKGELPTLADLFPRVSYIEDNEIVGFSLLQFFDVKDGKFVDKEGNTVAIYLPEKKQFLKIVDIDVKFVPLDDIELPINYIKAFCTKLFDMKNPERLLDDLSPMEREELAKVIADNQEIKDKESEKENEHKERKRKYEELVADADDLLKKEKYAEALEKYNTALTIDPEDEHVNSSIDKINEEFEKQKKAKVNPKFLYELKDYAKMQRNYEAVDGKEHILDDKYHLFVSPEADETFDTVLLIKRGKNWWEEPEEGEEIERTDKQLMYKFMDGEEAMVFSLNLQTNEASVSNYQEPAANEA